MLTMPGDELVLTGSRPTSALSSHRPHPAKQQGYHTVAGNSSVDESLFKSYHTTKLDEILTQCKAPWEYSNKIQQSHSNSITKTKEQATRTKNKGPPLLWCPTPRDSSSAKPRLKIHPTINKTSCLWSTRNHFRQLKHTPTFVDETLFGSNLDKPAFEAPWNERKKGERKEPRPLLWSPSINEQISISSQKLTSARNISTPIWKP